MKTCTPDDNDIEKHTVQSYSASTDNINKQAKEYVSEESTGFDNLYFTNLIHVTI